MGICLRITSNSLKRFAIISITISIFSPVGSSGLSLYPGSGGAAYGRTVYTLSVNSVLVAVGAYCNHLLHSIS